MSKVRQTVPQSNKTPQSHNLSLPLEEVSFVVFDLETTGGNPQKNGITEIFALKFCVSRDSEKVDPKSFETFHSLVNPLMKIPPIVRRMTGIDNNMLIDAPVIQDIFPQFLDFVGDACIVSHNVQGDLKFLQFYALQTAKKNFQNFFLCTHLLVEKLVPEAPVKSVKGLAQFFELGNKDFHRAEADAFVTLEIFKILLTRIRTRNIKTLEDALRFQNDKENLAKIGWGVTSRTLTDLPNAPGLFKLFDRERKLLFAASSFSVQKDIAKLQRSDQVPKSLAKIVLKTSDIQVDRHPNLFDAMLAEVDIVASSVKTILDPTVWHQRSLYFLCFSEGADDKIELEVCPLKSGVIAALGPVYDRQKAFDDLEKIAKQHQLVQRKESIEIPVEQYQEIKKQLTRRKPQNSMKEPSFFEWSFLSGLKKFFLRYFRSAPVTVLSIGMPAQNVNNYDDIFELSGVLAIASNSIGGYKLFPIVQSLPLEPITVRGANRENLQKNLMLKLETQGTFGDLEDIFDSHEAVPRLSDIDAKKTALLQWWIRTQAQDGIFSDTSAKKDTSSLFISRSELARIEKNHSKTKSRRGFNVTKFLLIMLGASAIPALAKNHCTASETTVFSCELQAPKKNASREYLSFCTDKNSSFLQLRLGTLGKPHTVLPKNTDDSFSKFAFGTHTRPGGHSMALSFADPSLVPAKEWTLDASFETGSKGTSDTETQDYSFDITEVEKETSQELVCAGSIEDHLDKLSNRVRRLDYFQILEGLLPRKSAQIDEVTAAKELLKELQEEKLLLKKVAGVNFSLNEKLFNHGLAADIDGDGKDDHLFFVENVDIKKVQKNMKNLRVVFVAPNAESSQGLLFSLTGAKDNSEVIYLTGFSALKLKIFQAEQFAAIRHSEIDVTYQCKSDGVVVDSPSGDYIFCKTDLKQPLDYQWKRSISNP